MSATSQGQVKAPRLTKEDLANLMNVHLGLWADHKPDWARHKFVAGLKDAWWTKYKGRLVMSQNLLKQYSGGKAPQHVQNIQAAKQAGGKYCVTWMFLQDDVRRADTSGPTYAARLDSWDIPGRPRVFNIFALGQIKNINGVDTWVKYPFGEDKLVFTCPLPEKIEISYPKEVGVHYVSDDIFNSSASALVNTVNCKGVMGKGLALQFQQKFPEIMEPYRHVCDEGRLKTGTLQYLEVNIDGKYIKIINFPTKDDWRNPSQIEWIEQGLQCFLRSYKAKGVKSISFPKLGCANGGLDWEKVKPVMERFLTGIDIPVYIHVSVHDLPKDLVNPVVASFNKVAGVDPAPVKSKARFEQPEFDFLGAPIESGAAPDINLEIPGDEENMAGIIEDPWLDDLLK